LPHRGRLNALAPLPPLDPGPCERPADNAAQNDAWQPRSNQATTPPTSRSSPIALTYRDVREAVNRASHNPSFGHHVRAWDAALAAVEDLSAPDWRHSEHDTLRTSVEAACVTREYWTRNAMNQDAPQLVNAPSTQSPSTTKGHGRFGADMFAKDVAPMFPGVSLFSLRRAAEDVLAIFYGPVITDEERSEWWKDHECINEQ
jgi:hypothetical protein